MIIGLLAIACIGVPLSLTGTTVVIVQPGSQIAAAQKPSATPKQEKSDAIGQKDDLKKWQTDWVVFVDELTKCVHSNECNLKASSVFGGKSVTWSGVFKSVKSAGEKNIAIVEMTPDNPTLTDPKGDRAKLQLVIRLASIEGWRDLAPNTRIAFKGTLGKGPLFFWMPMMDGNTFVFLEDAQVVPKRP